MVDYDSSNGEEYDGLIIELEAFLQELEDREGNIEHFKQLSPEERQTWLREREPEIAKIIDEHFIETEQAANRHFEEFQDRFSHLPKEQYTKLLEVYQNRMSGDSEKNFPGQDISMIKNIAIPRQILEDILKDGTREEAKGNEAFGNLVGYYNSIDDTIIIQKRYAEPSGKVGGYVSSSKLKRNFHLIAYFPKFMGANFLSHLHHVGTKRKKLIPAHVDYHTHQSGSWTAGDIWMAKREQERISNEKYRRDIKYASLLYILEDMKFRVIDGYGNNISRTTIILN